MRKPNKYKIYGVFWKLKQSPESETYCSTCIAINKKEAREGVLKDILREIKILDIQREDE